MPTPNDNPTMGAAGAPDRAPRAAGYCVVFVPVFAAIYLPSLVATGWTGLFGSFMLSAVASAVAWGVSRRRLAAGGKLLPAPCVWAALLSAIVPGGCTAILVAMWATAVSITGSPSDVPQISYSWVFTRAWAAAWIVAMATQALLVRATGGNGRSVS